MLEPLANPFIVVSKKYLSAWAKMISQLSIDWYHYVLILIDSHPSLTQKALAKILHIDKQNNLAETPQDPEIKSPSF